MKLTSEQKDILRIIVANELEYYDRKEDIYEEDIEYINELKKIYVELGGII